MKQVKFDIELVKKIQAGEINGTIKTRKGNPARFLREINDHIYPLMFAINESKYGIESPRNYTETGKYYTTFNKHDNDIILEIEEPKQECQFKPFDKVLVRDEDNGYRIWQAAFYSHFYIGRDNGYHVTTAGDFYLDGEIIPYEGNEHLLGTTNKPKED